MQWQIYHVVLQIRGNQSINQSSIQKGIAGDWHGQEFDSAYPLPIRQSPVVHVRRQRRRERYRDGGRIGSGKCRRCGAPGRYSMRCVAVVIGGRLCVGASVYLCLWVHVRLCRIPVGWVGFMRWCCSL